MPIGGFVVVFAGALGLAQSEARLHLGAVFFESVEGELPIGVVEEPLVGNDGEQPALERRPREPTLVRSRRHPNDPAARFEKKTIAVRRFPHHPIPLA